MCQAADWALTSTSRTLGFRVLGSSTLSSTAWVTWPRSCTSVAVCLANPRSPMYP